MASNSLCAEISMLGIAAAEGAGVKKFANVFHFQRTSPSGTLDKGHVESMFNTVIVPPILAAISVDYTQTYTNVRMVDDALDPTTTVTRTGVGGRSGNRLPDFASFCIQMKSATRGRFARGSKHFGPIAVSDTLGDTEITPTTITRLNAIVTVLLAGFTDSDGNVWQGVILSRKPPAQYAINPTTLVTYRNTACVVNLTIGTMRRRKVPSLAA
jgi:hypothetical protein